MEDETTHTSCGRWSEVCGVTTTASAASRTPIRGIVLGIFGRLKYRRGPVALFLVDQRMSHMTSVESLAKAIGIFPNAKRDLLTAYADTGATIRAINEAGPDYYLQKPWDPPKEHLYPIRDDQVEN